MKRIIEKVVQSAILSEEEAYNTMLKMGTNELSDAETVAIITALSIRGIQLNEMLGFQKALLELSLPISFESESIDVCGTGGDGKNTFNISTATAFILANMGYKVTKHGNYGVSSLCGSSNVLEALGYTFTTDTNTLKKQLDQTNICFLHAPLFHPALKRVAPLRKALGIATFFNGIGPLVNPAKPAYQLTGTYSLELAKLYQHVLRKDRTNFTVLHGLSGFDELTFIGSTRIFGSNRDEVITENPAKKHLFLADITGGNTVIEAAHLLTNVLSGKGSSSHNIVLAGNVALGIQTFQPKLSFEVAFAQAHEHILSGKSIQTLKELLQ